MQASFTRRSALALTGGALMASTRSVQATPETRDAAIRDFAGEAAIRTGRVLVDVPALVENGNAASLTVTVESPMTEADHVRRIAVFNETNPQPNVVTVVLGPLSGRARLSTRIRLAGSQRITAVAEMSDGTFWLGGADVIVTLAACVES
ncbi:SoxY-related AACIE arm protein [uncultured Enterovirga sp.]|uniref:SoxY-related AACIE arm protein n=1 Tax=uncultured Enterovirga sp. TaxID=2026352 RepID=UPI0035CBBE7C